MRAYLHLLILFALVGYDRVEEGIMCIELLQIIRILKCDWSPTFNWFNLNSSFKDLGILSPKPGQIVS